MTKNEDLRLEALRLAVQHTNGSATDVINVAEAFEDYLLGEKP
jgi:hypothetical protein